MLEILKNLHLNFKILLRIGSRVNQNIGILYIIGKSSQNPTSIRFFSELFFLSYLYFFDETDIRFFLLSFKQNNPCFADLRKKNWKKITWIFWWACRYLILIMKKTSDISDFTSFFPLQLRRQLWFPPAKQPVVHHPRPRGPGRRLPHVQEESDHGIPQSHHHILCAKLPRCLQ